MRVVVWRDGEGLNQRASQFSPRVTASDGLALNLLQLREQSHCTCQRVHRSVFGGADDASSLPYYREPPVHRDSAPHH